VVHFAPESVAHYIAEYLAHFHPEWVVHFPRNTHVDTLLNVLQLRYPKFEVVVVNDGSEDMTLPLLMDYFKLQPLDKVFKKHLETKPVRAVYQSRDYPNLIVVDKENGRRADANNAGADHARYPIICQIDADCVLEQDALLYMI